MWYAERRILELEVKKSEIVNFTQMEKNLDLGMQYLHGTFTTENIPQVIY